MKVLYYEVGGGMVIFSYLAYLNINKADKSENLWIVFVEYTIVYGVFIWEVFKSQKTNTPFSSVG